MKSYCLKQDIRENKCNLQEVDWIHSFSYMRGLDGVIPGSEKTTEEAKNNKDKDQTNNAEINLERSEGQSQQDYLRRLAAHIDEIKQQLENDDEGKIKAIGVLGSDAYDKLMILKALRPSFPKALFFTTDLDSRLMHPKEFDVTRNLIVAASFNLKLAKNLQKSIPPFRDSYQTAHFFATQIALDDVNNANKIKLDQHSINIMLGGARLFETGNNKAIALNYLKNENEIDSQDRSLSLRNILNVFTTNLSLAIGLSKDPELCSSLQDCKNAHLPPIPKNSTHILSALGIIIFSWIILVAYIWSEKFKKYLKKLIRLTKHWFTNCDLEPANLDTIGNQSKYIKLLILFIFFGILSASSYEIYLGENGEPFIWNKGVSIWPSEIIRLFAGIVGCLLTAKAITAVSKSNDALTKKFKLQNEPGNVARLWEKHCSKISKPTHLKAIRHCFVMFAIFAFLMFLIFGFPSVPYRGQASNYANSLALIFSVPVFIFLVMTVLVTTLSSKNLITDLNKLDSVWPVTKLREVDLRSEEAEFYDELTILRRKLITEKKYHLDEWLDIKFIAAHTKVVGNLIYYPFIILALMIFARSKIFDNWDLPISLVIVFLSAAALNLFGAISLRRAAERSRKNIIEKISQMKITLICLPDSSARQAMEKQIDLALTQIQEINEGAFRSITNDPALQALLIPFGGWGGVALLENFVLNGF